MSDRSEPKANQAPESPRDPRPSTRSSEKWQRLFGGLAICALLVLLVVVLKSTVGPPPAMRQPFDPELTNDAELRRVTEAISRIVTAPEDRRRIGALEVLEAVSVQSPGAADLREACVSTYRGLYEAQRATDALRAILQDADGGERSAAELTSEMRSRAGQLLRDADAQRERATQSRARCEELFRTAVARFGMNVQRPQSPSP